MINKLRYVLLTSAFVCFRAVFAVHVSEISESSDKLLNSYLTDIEAAARQKDIGAVLKVSFNKKMPEIAAFSSGYGPCTLGGISALNIFQKNIEESELEAAQFLYDQRFPIAKGDLCFWYNRSTSCIDNFLSVAIAILIDIFREFFKIYFFFTNHLSY